MNEAERPPALNDWRQVDLSQATFIQQSATPPVVLYWGEFDTPSDYFQALVMRPLDTLLEDPRFREQGLKDTWKVRTTIFNHHKGLNPRIGFATAEVSPEDEEVYLTIYKHNP